MKKVALGTVVVLLLLAMLAGCGKGKEADTTAPVISGVATSGITTSSANITWTTDEPATSEVEYGPTTAYGSTASLDSTLVASHSVNLSGLTSSTTYHYKVKSKDASGNERVSGDYTFTTATLPDTTPPVISGVSVSDITTFSATITWNTDEPATSQVEYGPTTAYGSTTSLDSTLVAGHSVNLSGLTSGTTYHHRVKSKDASGNERVSGDYTFATEAQQWAAYNFDFDTGSPVPAKGQGTPFDYTSGGLTAHFSSPSGTFSVQSYDTTFFTLPQFSGNYLYQSNRSITSLNISFSQQLTSIALTFATTDYHGVGEVEEPSAVKLTAYVNSTGTAPVGSATARGTFSANYTFPQGVLSFNSGGNLFNLAVIELIYQPRGGTNFLVDNITVTTSP